MVIYFANGYFYKYIFYEAARRQSIKMKIINAGTIFGADGEWVKDCFNSRLHHNHILNRQIAECIFKSIDLELPDNTGKESFVIQDYFIPYEIVEHVHNMKMQYSESIAGEDGVKGAIVMNCNPFTKGHLYLIEKAAAQVDVLYIFVVEEDKSFFPFDVRYEMVCSGVKQVGKNVVVIPSGQYILSNATFSQYFDKEKKIGQIEDMSYDIRIFGEVVCPEFGIKVRFAGEEPTDVVTKAYNESMKKILPEYGVKFIEVPRKQLDNGEVISATTVRALLAEKEWEQLKQYLPETTVEILKNEEIM